MREIWIIAVVAVLFGLGTACEEDEHCHRCAHERPDSGTLPDGGLDPVTAYCNCMLVNCHDPFHARWSPGSMDDPTALSNCSAEAEALPRAGSSVDTGNFLECRMSHCESAASNEAECPAALGDEVCM